MNRRSEVIVRVVALPVAGHVTAADPLGVCDNDQRVGGVENHAPTNRDFKSEINLYEKQVLVVHTADMNGDSIFNEADMKSTKHDIIWTNSLFLYPDRVVVKTYDHKQGGWLGQLERVIIPPKP